MVLAVGYACSISVRNVVNYGYSASSYVPGPSTSAAIPLLNEIAKRGKAFRGRVRLDQSFIIILHSRLSHSISGFLHICVSSPIPTFTQHVRRLDVLPTPGIDVRTSSFTFVVRNCVDVEV